MAFSLVALATLLVLCLLYELPVRRRYLRWGASDADVERVMTGDAEIPQPSHETTLAVTIDAKPADIWPWLVQMGYRRGGLYSYDGLDRLLGYLDAPSADRILPEFQRLDAGDVIPVGRGPGFPVQAIEPYRTLVLAGESDTFRWTWQFALYPLDDRRTRLVSRNRAHVPRTVGSAIFMRFLEPAAFLMTRKMLLGLKHRAEALAAERQTTSRHAA